MYNRRHSKDQEGNENENNSTFYNSHQLRTVKWFEKKTNSDAIPRFLQKEKKKKIPIENVHNNHMEVHCLVL